MSNNDQEFTIPSARSHKWKQVCKFIEIRQNGNLGVGFEVIQEQFYFTSHAIYESVRRYDCLELIDTKIVKHKNSIHPVVSIPGDVSSADPSHAKIRHQEGGLQNSDLKELVPDWVDSWFDPAEPFEISAEVRKSTPGVVLADPQIDLDIMVDFPHCDLHLVITDGQIYTYQRLLDGYKKYGLNYKQYQAYERAMGNALFKHINYNPFPILEVRKFDLQQDLEFAQYDGQYRRADILKLFRLQEYSVNREDLDPPERRRREIQFLNQRSLSYGSLVQELLSNSDKDLRQVPILSRVASVMEDRSAMMVRESREIYENSNEVATLGINMAAEVFDQITKLKQQVSITDSMEEIKQTQNAIVQHLDLLNDRLQNQEEYNRRLMQSLLDQLNEPGPIERIVNWIRGKLYS